MAEDRERADVLIVAVRRKRREVYALGRLTQVYASFGNDVVRKPPHRSAMPAVRPLQLRKHQARERLR